MRYVYGDLFWLLNFALNYLLLYLTGLLSGQETIRLRLILASSLGATYSLSLIYPVLGYLMSLSLIAVFSLIMLAVAFPPTSIRGLLRQAAWFYGLAFVAAGASMALGWHLSGSGRLNAAGSLLGGIVAVSATAVGMALRMKSVSTGVLVVPVSISLEGQVLHLKALVDTGNRLRDPFTGWPVMVAEAGALTGFLPDGVLEVARDPLSVGSLDEEGLGPSGWQKRLRLIPYSSMGQTDGLLFAIKPDWLSVGRGEEKQITDKVAVALSPSPLTEDGSYRALLPGDLWSTPKDQRRDHH